MAVDTGKWCQCEHISHFETHHMTPNGNPAHTYGQAFINVVTVQTPYGKFEVCRDCACDCYAQFYDGSALPPRGMHK